MVTRRRGHSLPELIVAVTFLGVSMAAVSGSTLLGARWSEAAVGRQRAVELAAATVDSVAASAAPGAGAATVGELEVRWQVELRAGAPSVVARVYRDRDSRLLATLWARPVPSLPALPEAVP